VVDEFHVALVAVLLGAGERLFESSRWPEDYRCTSFVATERVPHCRLVPR